MASLSQVVRVLSQHIFCTEDNDKQVFNDLRIRSVELTKIGRQGEEPLIMTEGRGRFSRDVSAKDCALLLISILVNDKANNVSEIVREVQNLKVVDIKSSDLNLEKIAEILEKPVFDISLLDYLTIILEDQAQGQEQLGMVTNIMSTHYKKLENQSTGFHFSIDWLSPKLFQLSAIDLPDEARKNIRHIHAYHEDAKMASQFESSFTNFGLSNKTIIEELKKSSINLPNSRYQALEQDDFSIQKNASYVRKIKIGGDVIAVLAELIREDELGAKMMADEMAQPFNKEFSEPILLKILFYLMEMNIRSFSDLNTKSERFLNLHREILEYCDKSEMSPLRIGDIRDIQRRFHDLDKGKQDQSEILNRVYEQYRYNKELLQQTLTGQKKEK